MRLLGPLIILVILAIFLMIFLQPHFEARTYHKVTGIEVTYWDAFFVDLDPSAHLLLLQKVNK